MMKRLILIIATLALTFQGKAQDIYVTSALTSLHSNNFEEAKADIDKAMTSPETKEKPKALFAKAQVYFALQVTAGDKYKAANPYRDAAQAIFKLVQIKPDYERTTVDQLLIGALYLYFNDGVKTYNDKKYSESSEFMGNVVKIYDMKSTRKFDLPQMKSVDTIVADAYQTLANSAFYAHKFDEAIPLLIKVKK